MGENQENQAKEPVNEKPKEFKVAEIWIKEDKLVLDASPEFWQDKLRALGVLEMCKDIVKKEPEKQVQPVKNAQFRNFIKNFKRK